MLCRDGWEGVPRLISSHQLFRASRRIWFVLQSAGGASWDSSAWISWSGLTFLIESMRLQRTLKMPRLFVMLWLVLYAPRALFGFVVLVKTVPARAFIDPPNFFLIAKHSAITDPSLNSDFCPVSDSTSQLTQRFIQKSLGEKNGS